MKWKTISDIQHDFRNNAYTPHELVTQYLDRIHSRNSSINAFLSIFDERALARAEESGTRIANGSARPLEGIPVAIKDNMLLKGERATAGSHILKEYTAVYTATAVARLEAQGAIVLGKTNLDEFAMGSSTEYSAFGPTKNPHDLSRVPGGSSGGSAAAVADDQCAFALGSDTGGSIRQPASFCGVVGFKPTYGRVSRYGLIAMSSSLDQIGPFARSCEDARIIYSAIAGKDDKDATSSSEQVGTSEDRRMQGFKGKRIGVPKAFLEVGMDENVKAVFDSNIEALRNAGATIVDVDLSLAKLALPVYYLVVTSEVCSNLARYDGIRYGERAPAEDLISQYIASRAQGFGEEAKRRILLGTFTLSAGYRDKYYKTALKVRDMIASQFTKVFSSVDIIATPTSPTAAFALGEKFEDPLTMYLSDLFTVPANIAHLPAISIPAGKAGGLPVGLQFMGPRFADERVLAYGAHAEMIFGRSLPPDAE